ncbi:hypothetical protein ABT404_25710 [Streptomyces hyaluromycini]|uniref:Uncharacterized protein n=1 Tax=Streptomyces hyaluromycini TaxID=1377993 RepID=A0ABV1X1D4_9ACTN
MPIDVSYGTVPDQAERTGYEIDVVVRGAVGQDGGAGFTDDLRAAADRGEVVLVDLARLYEGE